MMRQQRNLPRRHFEALRHTLAQIDSATKGTDVNAPAAAETKLIDTYQAAFTRAASLDADQIALVNGAMAQAGTTLTEDAVKAKDSNLAYQAATEKVAQSVTANGETLVMWLGLAGLAAGAVLAWLIGRGISRPVVAHVRGNAGARRWRQDGRDPRRRPQGRDRPDGRHGRRVQEQHDRGRPSARGDRAAQGRGGDGTQDRHAAPGRQLRGRHQGRGQLGRLTGHRDAILRGRR